MLLRSKKKRLAQSTAEYAILLSLVVAAALAMQHEIRRGLQGKMHDVVENFGFASAGSAVGGMTIGSIGQYEPQSGRKHRFSEAEQTINEEYVTDSDQIEFYSKTGSSETNFDSDITQ